MKHASTKPQLSVVPQAALEAIAAGLLDGETRCGYTRNDWREATDCTPWLEAASRHLIAAINENQKVDPDSGVDHLAKVMSNLAIVLTLQNYRFQGTP